MTVTGEAPLVDTTTSTVGANIDPRQMQELPINGRNWMDLTLLAPGARRNEGGGMAQFRQGYSQTNVDGQQMTINYHSQTDSEQPGFSRDAIAEFEVVANRFDATQGRSQGMIVNAVTKSGTNSFAGTFGGYFRSDKFNAKDFITDRVLPYSNQQVSTTFGGPIKRDRIHFFGSYGYEREPKTYTFTSPYPFFNIDQEFPSQVAHASRPARLSVHASDSTGGACLVLQQRPSMRAAAPRSTHRPPARGSAKRRSTTPPSRRCSATGRSTKSAWASPTTSGWTSHRSDGRADHFPYHPVLDGNAPVIQLAGYTFGAANSSTSSRTPRPFATTTRRRTTGAAATT